MGELEALSIAVWSHPGPGVDWPTLPALALANNLQYFSYDFPIYHNVNQALRSLPPSCPLRDLRLGSLKLVKSLLTDGPLLNVPALQDYGRSKVPLALMGCGRTRHFPKTLSLFALREV